jgi:serine protein kinase
LREVIEKKMFANTEELLPVISFTKKSSSEDQKKHDDFVQRMMDRGYTETQVRLVVDWFQRVQKSS